MSCAPGRRVKLPTRARPAAHWPPPPLLWPQGVRPAGLQKVHNQELADFINLCISPREQRPRSRMLLKHPYFDSIRPPGQLASKSQVRAAQQQQGQRGSARWCSCRGWVVGKYLAGRASANAAWLHVHAQAWVQPH